VKPYPLGPRDTEPPCGSVVLLHGTTGTAYQRQFSTSAWQPANGGVSLRWEQLFDHGRRPLLVYRAPDTEQEY
jgi:hypothetical protein